MRVGIRRGEEHGHWAALRNSDDDRVLASGCVHDGAHVVHTRLEVGEIGRPIRQPGAALVEPDEPAHAAEALEELRRARILPIELEMRDESRHEHDVDRPASSDFERDVDVTTPRVPDIASRNLDDNGHRAAHFDGRRGTGSRAHARCR